MTDHPRSRPLAAGAAGIARRGIVLASHPLGAAALAGCLALCVMLFTPPGGDRAAHLYLTQAWNEHGWQLWDNFWYSGRYAQVNYSLLFYPLAATVGLAVSAALAAAGSAAAFAALIRTRWPALATGPSAAFAVLIPLGVVAGTLPFLLGLAFALAALAALAAGRRVLAAIAILLTGPAHPLPLAFLLVALIAIALSSPRWWRARGAIVVSVALAASMALQAVLLRGFATAGGHYPFDPLDALAIAGFCGAGLLLTRGLPDQRPLRAVFLGYAVLSTAAFLVSSPLGGNAVRLMLLMGVPLLLLPLAARGFRPRGMAVSILAAALIWQALPALSGWQTVAETRAQNEEFWSPALAFIEQHHRPGERVHVVATADNWEAFHLARHSVPLSRGWFRQDDFPANETLYERTLTPARYASWLRRTAVRYVLLPDDPLDYSSSAEAELLHSGRSGLQVVARSDGWTIFEFPDHRPMATPADGISVLQITGTEMILRVHRPGTYRLRVRYTPYWQIAGIRACASPSEPWGTYLRADEAGLVRLSFGVRLGTFVRAVLGARGGCPRGPIEEDSPTETDRAQAWADAS